MNPYLLAAIFAAGLFAGAAPTRMYYEAKEDQRAKVEAEAALEQEKRNVEIVTQYANLLTGVSDWYQRNPVRVRVQGNKECPGGIATDLKGVILTIPGYQGDNSAGAVR